MKRDETALMRQQRRVQEFLMTRVGTEADRFFIIETQEAQLFQLANEICVCVCVTGSVFVYVLINTTIKQRDPTTIKKQEML